MADPIWRAAPPEALRIEPLGELTAIFDRRSMQTHLVTQPMPEILAVMAGDACNAAEVAARLAAVFDIEGQADTRALVVERLGELAAMGLVAAA
ncbi:MAG: HPr-rel-A system PqqD family peptide chaperone [Sphingopyxis sp.]